MVKQVEITEETHEGVPVLKVTFFHNGLDVNMLRFDSLNTLLNSIRQFYAGRGF